MNKMIVSALYLRVKYAKENNYYARVPYEHSY